MRLRIHFGGSRVLPPIVAFLAASFVLVIAVEAIALGWWQGSGPGGVAIVFVLLLIGFVIRTGYAVFDR